MGIELFGSSWAALMGTAAASWAAPAAGGGGLRRAKFYNTCGRGTTKRYRKNE